MINIRIISSIILAFIDSTLFCLSAVMLSSIFSRHKTAKDVPIKILSACIFCAVFAITVNDNLSIVSSEYGWKWLNTPLLSSIIAIISPFFISFLYKLKIYNRLLIVLIFTMIMGIFEIFVGVALQIFTSLNISMIQNSFLYCIGSIVSKFLMLCSLQAIKLIKISTLQGKFRKKWLAVYILPISTITTIFTDHYFLQNLPSSSTLELFIFIGMFLSIFSSLFIFNLINKMDEEIALENKLKFAEELIDKQTEQYNIVAKNNRTVAQFRHNYKNFLLGAIADLSVKKYDTLLDDFKHEYDLLEEASNNNICGDSIIDTIVMHKIDAAKQKDIIVEASFGNIKDLKISGIDIALLTGSALDNAIEATEEIKDTGKKRIELSVLLHGEQLVITVTNPVAKNIDTEHLQTGKSDTFAHGYGILTMKEIIKKYSGELSLMCQDLIFKTAIILPNDSL